MERTLSDISTYLDRIGDRLSDLDVDVEKLDDRLGYLEDQLEKHNELFKEQNQILALMLEQMRYLR